MKRQGSKNKTLPHEITSSVDWTLQFQGFSAHIEVIDGDIIHEISSGFLEEEHVDPLFNVYEKVIKSMGALEYSCYFIIGMTEVTGGTLKARKLYFRRMREWHKNHPLHMCVLYGPNRFMRAGFNLARPFMPFKVQIENDLDSALNAIIEEKAKGANALSSPGPEGKDIESPTSGSNQPYVDDLLDFMANIKWETNRFDGSRKIDPSHPFSPVFDSISLIKKDLDDLLEEQKRTEEALRKSEEKYRAVLENIEEGYYETDIAGNFRFFNDSFSKICGYARDEMLGMNYRQFVDEEDAKRIFEIFNSVYRTGGPSRTFDWEPVRKNSSRRSLETSLSLILDSEGQPAGFRGIIRDITERKRLAEELMKHRNHLEQMVQERTAELLKANDRLKRQIEARKKAQEALNHSEEKYRLLVENANDAIFIAQNETVRFQNSKTAELTGYSLEELTKTPFVDIIHPEDRDVVIDRLRRSLKGERFPSTYAFRIIDRDGEELWVEFNTVLTRWEGEPATLNFLTDIGEKMELQAQLQHAQKMEAIGAIASGVAHNFRNILAGISVNTNLIQTRYQENQPLMAIAEKSNNEVKKGFRLIDALMQFSRKRSIIKFEILNLSQVLHEAVDLINKSFDKRIDIRIDCPEYLPIVGDHSSLSQVILNLCINARDAMPGGGRLRIDAKQKADTAEVIISDTGHGMDAEALKKCFDPFFTTKDIEKGTGLGLSTSYGIIKDHKGDIHVYSEIGKGATFKITFPSVPAKKAKGDNTITEIRHGRGQKILIVDDETDILKPMEELLAGMGYRSASVSNGGDAIAIYASWQPDAVLMDRNMPEMDGTTIAERIIEQDPDARIILVSGYDEEGPDGIDFQTRGLISGYLTKPIDTVELSQVLIWLFSE